VDTGRLVDAIDDETLVVPISHVLFRSAFIQDVAAVVQKAEKVGAMVILDCYQSAGTVPFSLEKLRVHFAVGGSVKWLMGGPGAGYLYVRQDLIDARARHHRLGGAHPFDFQDRTDRLRPWIKRDAGTPAVAPLYQRRRVTRWSPRSAWRPSAPNRRARPPARSARAKGLKINSPLDPAARRKRRHRSA
jgi:kynureninase